MSMELNQKKMEFQSQNETYSINQQIQKVAENNKLIEVQNSAKIAALDNTLLYKDKEKQQEFTHQEIAMEVQKAGYGPNVLKAMILEKTEQIYKNLDISEMKVVNLGGGDGSGSNSTGRLIAETMATYNAMKS